MIGNFSTIKAADFDKDGKKEVFLGARCVPGNYGLPPQNYLLKYDNGNWSDITPASLGSIGMVTDAVWADVDSDGDNDLIVAGDWMGINIFKNEKGVLTNPIVIPDSKGWWNRIEAVDLNKDGKIDFILGNWGLNTKFKASPAKPLTMFVNDFDNNGKSEFIVNWYPPLDSMLTPLPKKMNLLFKCPICKRLYQQRLCYKTYESLFSPAVRGNQYHMKQTLWKALSYGMRAISLL